MRRERASKERLTPITRAFATLDPETMHDHYLVVGTVDRADGKRIQQNKLSVQDTIEALHDFKEVVIFKPVGGWGYYLYLVVFSCYNVDNFYIQTL